MTTTEHLNAIKARCHALLAIAEKRTPGRWESDGYVEQWLCGGAPAVRVLHWEHNIGSPVCMVAPDLSGACRVAGSKRPVEDAAFIASAAGPFEASLHSTIAAVDGLSRLEDWKFTGWDGDAGIRSEASAVLDDILAAWPLEIL